MLQVKADPATGKIIATLPKPDAERHFAARYHLSDASSRRGLGRRRSGSTGRRRRAAGSWSSGASARRSRPRSRIPNSSPAPARPSEQKAVRQSFASSTIWMGEVADTKPDGSFTVDLAGFLARDDLNIPQAIKQGGGGDFKFAADLSAADPNFVKLFPRNAEFAARLTFRSDEPTAEVGNIIPDGQTMTLTLRHSLIALPEPGYAPRHDPFGYTIARQQVDFSAPLGARHRPRRRHPLPAGEGRPGGGALAGHEADHLLHRSRRARAGPDGAARRRRAGGTRRSTPPASSTLSAPKSCPKAPIRSTSATMSSTGSTGRRAAGPTGRRSTIRAPARSSRARCCWARSERGRTC